jgi:uncharacterized protein HemY
MFVVTALVVGAIIATATVILAMWRWSNVLDRGSVSNRWLAENRGDRAMQ